MKILYLAPDSVPTPKGASVRIERTVATLRALGHEVELFTPPIGAGEPGTFLERMLRFRAEAGDWLAGRRADLVQFRSIWEGVAAIRWARRTGAPAVFEAHGLPSVELPYHFPALAREERLLAKIIAEERAVIGASDRLVAPSRTTARFLQRLGAPAGAVSVIPNAVDCALFSPGGAASAAGGLADEPPRRIAYVGTLAPWQGLGTLLEALALLRGAGAFELHVVGPAKGTWTRGLRRLVARLRLRPVVHVSGPMAQRDLVPVLRAAHVCVAPLPADARNQLQGCCPIKLLEYMAAGRPILSTRVAPVEEILEHGATGHLVAPGSASALAEGLRWMAEHPDEREALGRRAREAAVGGWGPEAFERRTREFLAPFVAARRGRCYSLRVDPGVYQISETADSALGRLAALAVYDRGIERRRRLCGWLTVACVPVLLFFLANDALADRTRVLGLAVTLGLGVLLFVRWRVYCRRDLDNRKIATLQRLLRVLRADIRHGERVALAVDLRPCTAVPPVLKQGAISRYRHRWLVLAVRLADDNVLRLSVSDRIKRKRKRKRTAERGTSAIALTVRLAKRYRPIEPIAAALRAGRGPVGLIVRQRQVTGEAVAPPAAAARAGRARGAGPPPKVAAAPLATGPVVRIGLRTANAGGAALVLADGDMLLHVLRWTYSAIAAARRAA